MFSSMSLAKRMGIAFATLVALVVVTAGVGYWSMQSIAGLAEHILAVDVVGADVSGQVQASALTLRRYEKAHFLNIGDGGAQEDYLAKWKAAREALNGQLTQLDGMPLGDEADARIAQMRASLAAYETGFEHVREQIRGGAITTAADANRALSPYKDSIRTL